MALGDVLQTLDVVWRNSCLYDFYLVYEGVLDAAMSLEDLTALEGFRRTVLVTFSTSLWCGESACVSTCHRQSSSIQFATSLSTSFLIQLADSWKPIFLSRIDRNNSSFAVELRNVAPILFSVSLFYLPRNGPFDSCKLKWKHTGYDDSCIMADSSIHASNNSGFTSNCLFVNICILW